MRSDYMKPEQYGKLFAYMSYENVLAMRVCLETGLRIGDAVGLRPEELNGRTITYVSEKTGKRGRAVISRDLAERLKRASGEEYIFPKVGKGGGHRSRQAVWRDVKKAAGQLRAAGLLGEANITPHSARKTFAVRDAEKYGILHTQKALQHSDKSTTKLYVYSEKYLADMTDNYVLKALIHEVKEIHSRLDDLSHFIDIMNGKCYDLSQKDCGKEKNPDIK